MCIHHIMAVSPAFLRKVVLPGAALLLAAVVAWFVLIPWPWGLRSGPVGPTALMEQRLEEAEARGETLELRQDWVALDAISPNLVRAVLVAEDDRFREHGGIDWLALAEEVQWEGGDTFSWTSSEDRAALRRALRTVWGERDELRGRSTITQQLAKNLYFGTNRTLLRKGMELVVSRRLERVLEKDRILEIYLNVAEWGPGVFGAEAAARTYFGKGAGQLTLFEAATLAATLPHPLTSNPHRAPARMEWRRNNLMGRLVPTPEVDVPEILPGDSLLSVR
ncbi:MAG: transglycosylase domain-containing protein [Gemmatimonadota bacterium]